MEQAEDSSPDPSSSACEIRNQPRFCGNHIPRKLLPQNRVRISFRHLPETLRAEHQRKMSFPFSRKISPPHQRSKEHFSLVLPSEARQWRNDSFVVRIISKIHSNFVQYTPPNRIKFDRKDRKI